MERFCRKIQGKIRYQISKILSAIENSIHSDHEDINKEEIPKTMNAVESQEELLELSKNLKETTKNHLKDFQNLKYEHLKRLLKYEKDFKQKKFLHKN